MFLFFSKGAHQLICTWEEVLLVPRATPTVIYFTVLEHLEGFFRLGIGDSRLLIESRLESQSTEFKRHAVKVELKVVLR